MKPNHPDYAAGPRPRDVKWNWRVSLAHQNKEAVPEGMEWITYATPGNTQPARIQ